MRTFNGSDVSPLAEPVGETHSILRFVEADAEFPHLKEGQPLLSRSFTLLPMADSGRRNAACLGYSELQSPSGSTIVGHERDTVARWNPGVPNDQILTPDNDQARH